MTAVLGVGLSNLGTAKCRLACGISPCEEQVVGPPILRFIISSDGEKKRCEIFETRGLVAVEVDQCAILLRRASFHVERMRSDSDFASCVIVPGKTCHVEVAVCRLRRTSNAETREVKAEARVCLVRPDSNLCDSRCNFLWCRKPNQEGSGCWYIWAGYSWKDTEAIRPGKPLV